MMRRTRIFSLVGLVGLAVLSMGFAPFTPVTNVCPTCKQPPADVVTVGAEKIRGSVVGENPEFYVVVRYNEARAIPRNEVQGIEWQNGSKPANISNTDQILLKNGVVFNGSIVEDKSKPALFQLRSSWTDQTYVIFKSEVQEAYRAGTKIDLGT